MSLRQWPGRDGEGAAGLGVLLHVDLHGRLVHDAGVFIAQVVREEAGHLVEVVDARSGG